MEQSNISGVGNIYKSESLFLAGISPKRIMKSLTKKEKRNFTMQSAESCTQPMTLVGLLFVTIAIYMTIMGSILLFHLI